MCLKLTSLQPLPISCAETYENHCNTQHTMNYYYPTDSIFDIHILLCWRLKYICTIECRFNAFQHISRYCINNYRNSGRISTRRWTHKDTPYLALTGELRGVFCEYLWENWPRYNSTALYFRSKSQYTNNYLIKHDVYLLSLLSSCLICSNYYQ